MRLRAATWPPPASIATPSRVAAPNAFDAISEPSIVQPLGARRERDPAAGAEADQAAAHAPRVGAQTRTWSPPRAQRPPRVGERRWRRRRGRRPAAARARRTAPTRTSACASEAAALPKPSTVIPRSVTSAACTSMPTASRRRRRSVRPRARRRRPGQGRPRRPCRPRRSTPGFVSPPFVVCVAPSIAVNAPVIAGSATVARMRTTPDCIGLARPARRPGRAAGPGTMKMLASTPGAWPACARPALPSALALTMNWRSEPCPLSRMFVITSKLYPKSRPGTSRRAERRRGATDCGVAAAVVSDASAAAVRFAAASGARRVLAAHAVGSPRGDCRPCAIRAERLHREQRRHGAGPRRGHAGADHADRVRARGPAVERLAPGRVRRRRGDERARARVQLDARARARPRPRRRRASGPRLRRSSRPRRSSPRGSSPRPCSPSAGSRSSPRRRRCG